MTEKINSQLAYSEMSIASLLHHLFDAHQYLLKKAFSSFYRQYEKIQLNKDNITNRVIVVVGAFNEMELFLKQHLKKEEELFNGFLDSKTGNSPVTLDSINKIKREHEAIKYQLQNIRRLSNDYHVDEKASSGLKLFYAQLFNIEQDIHKHIFLQEDVLFPKLKNLIKS